MDESTLVAACHLEVGDVISFPSLPAERCRVQLIRNAVSGVLWVYLVDVSTGQRLRRHLALTVNEKVRLHDRGA